ncbi:hypothetical protein FEM48_Zijuj05G0108200 [Ziziphus jujuba var. spinosa]|uniref:Uncharacterized protein n=1 Tax=Ziziphus jujuba var. spinosa TaxID=714518 RepID=A0A978VEI9_ZIZJJ|nr:hypothetical protein FEM48_Zijuj05G0108200 [Ziziphus jujuba var. spinosa]
MYRNNGDPKLAAQAYGSQPRGQWTTGLCGCCEEPCNSGFIYFILGSCACLYSHTYRAKLRGLYSLPEEPCSDCCVHCWCACCANCQEYREFKNRGVDPSAGWTANAEKMNRNGTTAPPYFAPGMAR